MCARSVGSTAVLCHHTKQVRVTTCLSTRALRAREIRLQAASHPVLIGASRRRRWLGTRSAAPHRPQTPSRTGTALASARGSRRPTLPAPDTARLARLSMPRERVARGAPDGVGCSTLGDRATAATGSKRHPGCLAARLARRPHMSTRRAIPFPATSLVLARRTLQKLEHLHTRCGRKRVRRDVCMRAGADRGRGERTCTHTAPPHPAHRFVNRNSNCGELTNRPDQTGKTLVSFSARTI